MLLTPLVLLKPLQHQLLPPRRPTVRLFTSRSCGSQSSGSSSQSLSWCCCFSRRRPRRHRSSLGLSRADRCPRRQGKPILMMLGVLACLVGWLPQLLVSTASAPDPNDTMSDNTPLCQRSKLALGRDSRRAPGARRTLGDLRTIGSHPLANRTPTRGVDGGGARARHSANRIPPLPRVVDRPVPSVGHLRSRCLLLDQSTHRHVDCPRYVGPDDRGL